MNNQEQKQNMLFCEVVFAIPIDHAFTYEIPGHLQSLLCPGFRVLAPFGKRKLTGFVVRLSAKTELTELREIEDVLDSTPAISAEMLELTRWIADYYMASWGEVIDAALPNGINLESHRKIHLETCLDREKILTLADVNQTQKELLLLLHRKGSLLVNQLSFNLGQTNLNYNLMVLEKKGYVSATRELIQPKVKIKFENLVKLAPSLHDKTKLETEITNLSKKNSPQAEQLKELARFPEGLSQNDLLRRTKTKSSALKVATKNHLVAIEKREVFRDYYSSFNVPAFEPIALNADQKNAVQELVNHIVIGKFAPVLLYGVTGSGKTQVYIEALTEVRKQNRTAIVLVPEIALTPQTVSRFRAHFGSDVAVLHSRMSDGERYDSWRKIRQGKVRIVIGPRSAIFAPLQNIGLIVVDEEHESSYKQGDQNPRYHARDVALVRGKNNHAIVILGSATPSIESFYNARTDKYRLLEMPRRVADLPLPKVDIVDMREEWQKFKGVPSQIFSHAMIEKIAEKIALQEQIILLQNRRGFSTFILCKDCGHVERCINCNITLTYHMYEHRLRCHYCDYQKAAPQVCPNCHGYQITYKGTGTQRVEEEIKKLFLEARVVRMDLDTTTRKGAHDRILRDFRDGLFDILLGTQMVAKGLDFPKVTLVGVISADTTLQLPDFRAGERTFQLLTQVAGRSGRKTRQGEVIIQTYNPLNHSIIFAKKHDYLRFFAKEMEDRKDLSYPPFSRLVVIEFRGRDEETVSSASAAFARALKPKKFYRLLGPAPAPLSRLKEEYRYHLIIKYSRQLDPLGKNIRTEIQAAQGKISRKHLSGIKLNIDVDPMDLF